MPEARVDRRNMQTVHEHSRYLENMEEARYRGGQPLKKTPSSHRVVSAPSSPQPTISFKKQTRNCPLLKRRRPSRPRNRRHRWRRKRRPQTRFGSGRKAMSGCTTFSSRMRRRRSCRRGSAAGKAAPSVERFDIEPHSDFSAKLPNFTGLIPGCIDAKFCRKIFVGKLLTRSTRFTCFCTAQTSIFQ